MNKTGKIAVVLCLTAAILLGLGWLPWGVFRLMDSAGGTAQTAELATPVLELEQEESAEETAMRLLALERDLTSAPVSMDLATRTTEEMYEIAEAYAEEYLAAFQSQYVVWNEANLFLDVQLAIDPNNYNNNMLYWAVSYVQQGSPYTSVFLHIDDKTGKLLYLNADITNREFYTENDYMETLEKFAELYFNGLGVEDYGDAGNREAGMNEYSHWIRYTFTDETYGAVGVEFYISGKNANVRFLNEEEIRQSEEGQYGFVSG